MYFKGFLSVLLPFIFLISHCQSCQYIVASSQIGIYKQRWGTVADECPNFLQRCQAQEHMLLSTIRKISVLLWFVFLFSRSILILLSSQLVQQQISPSSFFLLLIFPSDYTSLSLAHLLPFSFIFLTFLV